MTDRQHFTPPPATPPMFKVGQRVEILLPDYTPSGVFGKVVSHVEFGVDWGTGAGVRVENAYEIEDENHYLRMNPKMIERWLRSATDETATDETCDKAPGRRIRIRELFLTPEGKITRRNAQFIVRVVTWFIRKRPTVRDTSLDGVATRLHQALISARLPIKRKKLIHVLRMGERLGVLEIKR